ncbi:nucleotidyltransferase domain-containing protein [Neobacillus niacini]|uniref:nucleotidyltransferase domain-containing protein n=1 Tax=Neobacillus niacini TaxID=86668 RepID=UPI003982DEEC
MLRTDIDNWLPISIKEIHQVFSNIPAFWCLAGGEALDLHMGKKSREHSDVDVVIYREQQQILYQSLSREWTLYKVSNKKLTPWRDGEFLESINDVWVSKNANSPFSFQLMFLESVNDEWVYRREKSIRVPKSRIYLKTSEGIPYLKPEIQLLYKAGSSRMREKDFKDFQTLLPVLTEEEKDWLKLSLITQFPEGHHWIGYL